MRCPPPGHLPNPGIEPMSPATPALQEDSLSLSHQGSQKLELWDPEAGCQVHRVGRPSAGHDWPWWQIGLTHTEGTQASQVALGVKNSPANAGDLREAGLISGLGRSPGRGYSNPLQYFCLESPKDRGAWRATVHGVANSWTQLKRLFPHARGHPGGISQLDLKLVPSPRSKEVNESIDK